MAERSLLSVEDHGEDYEYRWVSDSATYYLLQTLNSYLMYLLISIMGELIVVVGGGVINILIKFL